MRRHKDDMSAIRDIDEEALARAKATEAKLLQQNKLVSRTLPDGSVITTTKERMEQLYADHTSGFKSYTR
ncbi:MAG: hypothetical protein K2K97_06410 [Muribaculaceae bacterium]|nr:hypothetical protein [Muribaculaceae bacterium]